MTPKIDIRTLCVAAAIPLLLTACGGGGGDSGDNATGEAVEPTPEQTNRAPQAVAGVSRTVMESDSVILDARNSSDEDGDALSYVWTQLSGPEVALSNTNSSQPSFVAPAVDAATELSFELQVTDATGAVSTDALNITVQNQPVLGKQLMVQPTTHALTAQAGQSVDVAFQYESSEGSPSPTGLMLKLHWDSSKLSFKELSEVLAVNHLGVSPIMQDAQDADHNPDTDQYVILSWLDHENISWPSNVSLPAALFSANFEPVAGVSGSTHVTLSPHFNTPGYTLHTQSVSVEL